GPGGPGQNTTVYLTASGSSFALSTSAGNVYVYQPDTAMASLTGTLDYVVDYDNGESVTEAQVLANASVLFKTGVNATQQTLAWTDSRVSYSWNPALSSTQPGVYEMNVYVLDTYLGAIRVIATSANLGSTAPEPPQYEIPEWPTDPTPTPDPTEPPTGLMGDVNLNGTVDASDALIVLRYAMNLITLTDEQLAVADMNGNGKVDATDAVLIMRYALGVSGN
ncbi:MAG: dockerin type I repeat-containing protein, partial [Clostridia bacterium]|nr:dockerin type I repeat-containing protein [Clostridia bacterium]